jgi:hypothetical protein
MRCMPEHLGMWLLGWYVPGRITPLQQGMCCSLILPSEEAALACYRTRSDKTCMAQSSLVVLLRISAVAADGVPGCPRSGGVFSCIVGMHISKHS